MPLKYELFDAIAEQGRLEEFFHFALCMRNERRWSLYNSALAFTQNDGCAHILTRSGWEKIHRYIKPGARPIVILRRYAAVTYVYDLADTEGEPLPESIRFIQDYIEPEPQPIADYVFPYLKKICHELGILYEERPMGSLAGGSARKLKFPQTFYVSRRKSEKKPGKKWEITYPQVALNVWHAITINSNCNTTMKTFNLLHEMGHILCGHLPLESKEKKGEYLHLPLRDFNEREDGTLIDNGQNSTGYLDRFDDPLVQQMEWEAEKVCQVTCRILGFKYDPSEYLRSYGAIGDKDAAPGSLQVVLMAADKIVNLMEKIDEDKEREQREALKEKTRQLQNAPKREY